VELWRHIVEYVGVDVIFIYKCNSIKCYYHIRCPVCIVNKFVYASCENLYLNFRIKNTAAVTVCGTYKLYTGCENIVYHIDPFLKTLKSRNYVNGIAEGMQLEYTHQGFRMHVMKIYNLYIQISLFKHGQVSLILQCLISNKFDGFMIHDDFAVRLRKDWTYLPTRTHGLSSIFDDTAPKKYLQDFSVDWKIKDSTHSSQNALLIENNIMESSETSSIV
jgi:hypothetical protein